MATDNSKTQVFLEGDDPIRGQEFVCLSFISPEKVLKNKDLFFFTKFMEYYAMDYKIKATESFVMDKLRDIQNTLSDVELTLQNEHLSSGEATEAKDVTATLKGLVESVTKTRETLARTTASDLEAHVKKNISDFKETTITAEYEKFMMVNRQKLEDQFHKDNDFKTTIRGLKIRGSYATHEQASARAKALHKKDPIFSVYVAQVGEWLPWDPEPEEIQEQSYQNEQLNKLMEAYKENAAKRDAFYEEEKRQKLAEAAAAAKAAKQSQKVAVFGEKGKEQEVTEEARELFDRMGAGAPDLAIQRKEEAAAAAASDASADVIIHG
jgi:hypothetical protein